MCAQSRTHSDQANNAWPLSSALCVNRMEKYLIYFVIFIVIFNVYVNIKLLMSSSFERFQKIAQSIIIWLIPVIGASIVLYFVNDSDKNLPPPSKRPNYANDSMPGGVQ